MPNFGMILVILGVWLIAALTIGIVSGKIFKKSREREELELAVIQASWSINKFLDKEEDNAICVYRDNGDGSVRSEEAMDHPEPCIICLDDGCVRDEDVQPPLVVIADRYLPLCPRHKAFVHQCIEEKILIDGNPESPPSE